MIWLFQEDLHVVEYLTLNTSFRLHTNMMDVEEIRIIEKQLRSLSIRSEMFYKPNIFSTLGIYRNNMYKLRPSIYISQRDKQEDNFNCHCIVDENWKYKRSEAIEGSPDANNNMDDMVNLVKFLKEKLHDAKQNIMDSIEDVNEFGKEYTRKMKAEKAATVEASAPLPAADGKKKKYKKKREFKDSKTRECDIKEDDDHKEPDITGSVKDPVMEKESDEKKDHVVEKNSEVTKNNVIEKTSFIPDVEDDTKSVKDPVVGKIAEENKEVETKSEKYPVIEKNTKVEKKKEHVPKKSPSMSEVEDETKSVKDPVIERKAEDEKKMEPVPEKSSSM